MTEPGPRSPVEGLPRRGYRTVNVRFLGFGNLRVQLFRAGIDDVDLGRAGGCNPAAIDKELFGMFERGSRRAGHDVPSNGDDGRSGLMQ